MINKFHPSQIVDDLYDFTDNLLIGVDRYDADIKIRIPEWFEKNHSDLDVKINIYDIPEDGGGTLSVAWSENGFVQMESFEYWY